MLNQRLLAALLAVTTVTATVAVNVSPCYALPPASSADDAARGAKKGWDVVWSRTKQIYEIISIPGGIYSTYQAAEAALNHIQQSQQPPQQPPQQYQQPQSGNRYITPENLQRVYDGLDPYYNR